MANTAPVVTPIDETVFVNGFIRLSDLFSVFDADGDSITRYRFMDFNADPGTGFIEVDSNPRGNGAVTTLFASELADAFYIGGSTISNEGLRIEAFDGTDWSPAAVANIYTVRENLTKPETQLLEATVLGNEWISASSFISAFDPDGWPIQKFFIKDSRVDHAYFRLGNQTFQQNQFFTVKAEDLNDLRYYGEFRGTETIKVFAYDGGTWSSVGSTEATTRFNQSRPNGQYNRVVTPTRGLMEVAPNVLWSDADGNTAKTFAFYDSNPHSHSGYLQVDGVAQPSKQWIYVPASQLNSVRFVGAERIYGEKIRFRVYDGRYWSPIETLEFDMVPRPAIGGPKNAVLEHLTSFPLSEVFMQIDDGPQHLTYELLDNNTDPTSGNLFYNVFKLDAGEIHTVTAVELEEEMSFETGAFFDRSLDEVYARAWNGTFYSEWTRLNVRGEPEYLDAIHRPAVDPDWREVTGLLPGEDLVLTFSFMQQFPDYETGEAVDQPDNDPPRPFIQFTADQRRAARRMFQLVETFADVTFIEVADTGVDPISGNRGGTIRLGNYTLEPPTSTASAFAFFPGTAPQSGDIWVNSIFNPLSGPAWENGGGSYTTLLHELGHAMGMNHPFVAPGGGTQKPVLPTSTDSDLFTVMSYTGSPNGASPWSYSLYDIINLQEIYGANETYANGDDYYSIDNFWDGDDRFFWSIWDTGGHDTIDAEGSLINATIDLRAGGISSLGAIRDNLTIAFGVEIEDAIGGNFGDTLIGNELDNVLTGLRGNDTLWGAGGDDLMIGGIDADTYLFGIADGTDTINEDRGGGRDTLSLRAFPELDVFEEDLSFRLEQNNLVVDLTLNEGDTEGTLIIENQLWGLYRVETLELGSLRVDLVNLASQATPFNQSFRPTADTSPYGNLVVPV